MVEETAGLRVQCADRGHVLGAQLEIKNCEILGHAFLSHRLGENDDASLRHPAEDDLCHAALVSLGDAQQQRVCEDVIAPLGERSPGFRLDIVCLKKRLRIDLLMEGIDFDLIDRRYDLVVNHQVHEAVRMKVRNADGLDRASAIRLLHRAPLAIYVAIGLMNQVQVEVFQLQPLERPLQSHLRPFVAVPLNPELRGDEQLLPGDAASLDPPPDCFLVEIGSGSVDVAIADLNGVDYALLALRRIGYLENAEAEERYAKAIIQLYLLHGWLQPCKSWAGSGSDEGRVGRPPVICKP